MLFLSLPDRHHYREPGGAVAWLGDPHRYLGQAIAVSRYLVYYALPKNNGQSTAYSPLVFDCNPVMVKATGDEGIFLATFDMDKIREFRRKKQWRLDYRMSFEG